MTEQILSLLAGLAPLPAGVDERIKSKLKRREIPKNRELVSYGDVCKDIFYVETGMIVAQTIDEGLETTGYIVRNGDVVNSPQSFFLQQPSSERLITVEPCVIEGITWRELEDMYDDFPGFDRHGRLLVTQYYLRLLDQVRFKCRPLKTKYLMLMQNDPDLIARCPAKYLASYLGANPTTLSTIRSEIMAESKVSKSKEI